MSFNTYEVQLFLSRPYLTKNQILCAQKNTIVDRRTYNRKKIAVIRFLTDLCLQLKFPRKTLETAVYFYQRYHLFNNFETELCYEIATSCLVLSCKQVETFKKTNEVCSLSLRLRNVSNITFELLDNFKRRIFQIELRILESCNFDYRINNHSYIEDFIIKIGKKLSYDFNICFLAWVVAYDVLKLDILLTTPPHAIALAVLRVACQLLDRLDWKEENYDVIKTTPSVVDDAYFAIVNFFINSYDVCDLKNILPDYVTSVTVERFILIKSRSGPEVLLPDVAIEHIVNDPYLANARNYSTRERRYILSAKIMKEEAKSLIKKS